MHLDLLSILVCSEDLNRLPFPKAAHNVQQK